MTNGEKWLAKAHKRIAGYCAARGWKCGPAVAVGNDQYEAHISDRYGKPAVVAFEMYTDEAGFVDDYGRPFGDFNVATFEDMTFVFALAPKIVVSKRQLTLSL